MYEAAVLGSPSLTVRTGLCGLEPLEQGPSVMNSFSTSTLIPSPADNMTGSDTTAAFQSSVPGHFSTTTPPAVFVPCRNPHNLLSEQAALTVELVVHAALFPLLVPTGLATNVINMVVFARQGLSDRINLCLFR